MRNKLTLLAIFVFIIVIIFILIVYKKEVIDKFDNLENNIFTYDTCCKENQIADCEKYGRTGMCYNNKCVCLDAY